MTVAASMADKLPSIRLNYLDDIPDLHDLPKVATDSTF